jgi:hypothetical protein
LKGLSVSLKELEKEKKQKDVENFILKAVIVYLVVK